MSSFLATRTLILVKLNFDVKAIPCYKAEKCYNGFSLPHFQ